MFLLSNLAFAAGGGGAAAEGDAAMLGDMRTTRVFFHVEYSLALEPVSQGESKEDDTTEFVRQRNELKELYEQMNQISMQISTCGIEDRTKLAEEYSRAKTEYLEASKIRLAVLKQLAEERKIELKPLPEGMVSEDLKTNYINHSLDFDTTRREFFYGDLSLGESFFNSFEKIAEKLKEIGASEDLISFAQKCHTELQGYFKEFKDKNPEYKTVLAHKVIINDFNVIDLFLEMNQLNLKIEPLLNAFIQKGLDELGSEFFEKTANESFVLAAHLSYHVSPSYKEIKEEGGEKLRIEREKSSFVVEGLLQQEQD